MTTLLLPHSRPSALRREMPHRFTQKRRQQLIAAAFVTGLSPSLGHAALALAIFFGAYRRDHQTFDAHLERAGAARLRGQHDAAAQRIRASR
ncbi:MAG: hypothetical protein WKF84_17490 [Pyrinomonadaceae bacterium]